LFDPSHFLQAFRKNDEGAEGSEKSVDKGITLNFY